MEIKKVFLAITIMAVVTFFTRAFPFLLFGKSDAKVPPIVLYLGKYLPPALICIIIVYCFKHVNILRRFNVESMICDYREIIAVIIIVFLHLFKKNTMLSILGGTAVYMILKQGIFK